MWTREILPFVAALVAIALWSFLMIPLLLRLLGVPISMNPRKRGKLKWDLRQSMLFGVLVWGVGMIIANVTNKYISWKLTGTPSDQLTLLGFGRLVLTWTLGGVLFGLFMCLNNKQSGVQPNREP
jgi:hypothetical protein